MLTGYFIPAAGVPEQRIWKEPKESIQECVVPKQYIFVENESTNTGENIRFSAEVLKLIDNQFCFENGIKSVIAVCFAVKTKKSLADHVKNLHGYMCI